MAGSGLEAKKDFSEELQVCEEPKWYLDSVANYFVFGLSRFLFLSLY